jgi:hypothetical protein
MALQRVMAEVVFNNPNDVSSAVAELIELDYDVRELDWIDDDSNCMWLLVTTFSALDDQNEFFDEIRRLANALGGDVIEAGLAPPNFDAEAWIAAKEAP